jgi:hypothetical protein
MAKSSAFPAFPPFPGADRSPLPLFVNVPRGYSTIRRSSQRRSCRAYSNPPSSAIPTNHQVKQSLVSLGSAFEECPLVVTALDQQNLLKKIIWKKLLRYFTQHLLQPNIY